jgi:hypothetical protein
MFSSRFIDRLLGAIPGTRLSSVIPRRTSASKISE